MSVVPTSLRDTLTRLPKVELHVHLEGTMLADTLAELARKNGVSQPAPLEEMYRYANLTGFLDVFWFVQSVLQTREDWAMLSYESVLQAASNGVVYREVFFTPARHLRNGMSLADIVAGIDDGLSAGERETGSVTRMIYDIDRDFGGAVADEQMEMLIELRRRAAHGSERIIGIGMDSTERGVDPCAFAGAYTMAKAAGLHRTAHQGEDSPASAIGLALDVLDCERIDHGISVLDDRDLLARLVDEQIPLTVCPSANVIINPDKCPSLGQHAFPTMREAGLLATLNTDDPALVGLSLGAEYTNVANTYGYSVETMVQIAHDGVTATWASEDEKQRMHGMIDEVSMTLRDAS
ncbi:MAG: putative adenosine deaminase 3 (Adenosine aminohydrolase 3) [Ilumatobacteraceae bacterium]|nr:putative adenosine deaminase 3 (Adenosine aminohydrolase 3) [Ilumatobacteraceae bacterium]